MTTMSLRGRLLCRIVIILLMGGLWSNQARTAEPGNSSPAIAPQPPGLNEKDLFPYKQKGRGTLAGQAFLSSPSGKAITQAGAQVHLIPITPYTRHWFDHTIRTTSCSATGNPTSAEGTVAPRPLTDCAHEALTRLQTEKRLAPYPQDQSQPHRTFLVYQDSCRALLHRQPDRRGIGTPRR